MKKNLFLFAFAILVQCVYAQQLPEDVSLKGKVIVPEFRWKQDSGIKPVRFVLRCPASFTKSDKPLYVIDGVPFPDFNLNILDAKNIESIEILKPPTAAAIYGNQGSVGVVIIKTKQEMVRIPVVDSLNGAPVAHALFHVSLYKRCKKNIVLAADSSGYLNIKKSLLASISSVTVSSVGYNEKEIKGSDMKEAVGSPVRLGRKESLNEMAFVRSGGCIIRRRICEHYCVLPKKELVRLKQLPTVKAEVLLPAAIFPNPAKRAGLLNIRFTAPAEGQGSVQVISISGKPVVQSGILHTGKLQDVALRLPQQIAAGVYVVLVRGDADGRVLFSQRVVVE
jgi:TonB-dependent SusC/RagA subfamily outer membrane receptor